MTRDRFLRMHRELSPAKSMLVFRGNYGGSYPDFV